MYQDGLCYGFMFKKITIGQYIVIGYFEPPNINISIGLENPLLVGLYLLTITSVFI